LFNDPQSQLVYLRSYSTHNIRNWSIGTLLGSQIPAQRSFLLTFHLFLLTCPLFRNSPNSKLNPHYLFLDQLSITQPWFTLRTTPISVALLSLSTDKYIFTAISLGQTTTMSTLPGPLSARYNRSRKTQGR